MKKDAIQVNSKALTCPNRRQGHRVGEGPRILGCSRYQGRSGPRNLPTVQKLTLLSP